MVFSLLQPGDHGLVYNFHHGHENNVSARYLFGGIPCGTTGVGEEWGAKSRVAGPNEITLSWVEKQSSDNKLGLCVEAVIKLCNCAA